MATAFGPQSPNYVTAEPSTDPNVSGLGSDTWFKDCSSALAADGTVVTASWLNVVLGNLRYACRTRGVPLLDGDNTMLYQALLASSSVNYNTAIAPTTGVYPLLKTGDIWVDPGDNAGHIWALDSAGTGAWWQIF